MANTDITRTIDDRPTTATRRSHIALGFWIRAGIVGVGMLVAGIALLFDQASGHGWIDALILSLAGGALAAYAFRRVPALLGRADAPSGSVKRGRVAAAEPTVRVRVSTIAS